MRSKVGARAFLAFALSAPWASLIRQGAPSAQRDPGTAELSIRGNVAAPLVLSIADLKKLPRKNLNVLNPHEKKTEVYEGVSLSELLRRAGVPQVENLRGQALATCILAEAAEGYRVVFFLAELDSDFVDSDVIVADTLDGAPLGPKQGPFKLVAPHEKRPAVGENAENLDRDQASELTRSSRFLRGGIDRDVCGNQRVRGGPLTGRIGRRRSSP